MAKCKYCGEEVPLEQLLPHINSKHREVSRSKKKPKTVGDNLSDKNVLTPAATITEPTLTTDTEKQPETPPAPEIKPTPTPAAASKTEGNGKGEITTPQASSEGIFRYTITLPADAFTLFNLAKTCGLENDKDKIFDEWLWDCVRMRYKTDYKMRLVLAPEGK